MTKDVSLRVHSHETMRQLKTAALPTRQENFSPPEGMSRRDVMRLLMGASSGLALGLAGCERKPRRQIISRTTAVEYQKPGQALYYSSTWMEGAYPYGVMVKTVDGRPVKIDGNPDHPINQGSTSAAMQASILSLYDPDRLRGPHTATGPIRWAEVDQRVTNALRGASRVVLMTRATLGPAQQALIKRFLAVCPSARHVVHEAIHDGPRRSVWGKVYGTTGEILPRFDRATMILSLDSDFLGTDGAVLENIRLFAAGRKLEDNKHEHAGMSRLYVVESAMTVTGSSADEHIRLRPSGMAVLARALLRAMDGESTDLHALAQSHSIERSTLDTLAADLQANRGKAIVVAGPHLPPAVHAAVAMLNDRLEAPGQTLDWNPLPPTMPVDDPAGVEALFSSGVDVAIFLDVNPAYDWPGNDFAALLAKVPLSVGHGLHRNETLEACSIALPSNHDLESWDDAQPRPGVRSLCQPVIAPLYESRQAVESLLAWTKALSSEGDDLHQANDWHDYLRRSWQDRLAGEGKSVDGRSRQRSWEDALRRGGSFEENDPAAFPPLQQQSAIRLAQANVPDAEYEAVIQPHHSLYDGRFANNGWLYELPDPVSKLVWDSPASLSAATAQKLAVREGDVLTVRSGGRSVDLPVLIQPGMADGVVALSLGYGRTRGGRILQEAGGVNVARLLGGADAPTPRWIPDVQLVKGDGRRELVRVQKYFSMEGRPIVVDGTLAEYRADAAFVEQKRHLPKMVTMYPPIDYSTGHKWAMAIDLGACVGCNACVAACQAENNIPIVGKEQCGRGREMHWLRIDRYEEGDPADPTVHQQPMLCQHCDNATCESVCPVNATAHSPEGLNEMAYNRCVGTRYCSNNCPYKVRRFNYLRYHEARLEDPVQELVFNPQVTVRGVGVMEKCTFCVQRINEGKYRAKNEGRLVKDGEITTACQQACPAKAITFGDVNDPQSRIAEANTSKRAFRVLEEFNMRPNVAYQARVRNPGSSKPGPSGGQHHG